MRGCKRKGEQKARASLEKKKTESQRYYTYTRTKAGFDITHMHRRGVYNSRKEDAKELDRVEDKGSSLLKLVLPRKFVI